MKLYILRPKENLLKNDNPWGTSYDSYDSYVGFVIRANSPTAARKMAQQYTGGEKQGERVPWRDPKYSTCEELKQEGEIEVIMEDFNAG